MFYSDRGTERSLTWNVISRFPRIITILLKNFLCFVQSFFVLFNKSDYTTTTNKYIFRYKWRNTWYFFGEKVFNAFSLLRIIDYNHVVWCYCKWAVKDWHVKIKNMWKFIDCELFTTNLTLSKIQCLIWISKIIT